VLMKSFDTDSPVFQRMKRLGRGRISVKKREGSAR